MHLLFAILLISSVLSQVDPCNNASGTTCDGCTAMANCGWCSSINACITGTLAGPIAGVCLNLFLSNFGSSILSSVCWDFCNRFRDYLLALVLQNNGTLALLLELNTLALFAPCIRVAQIVLTKMLVDGTPIPKHVSLLLLQELVLIVLAMNTPNVVIAEEEIAHFVLVCPV